MNSIRNEIVKKIDVTPPISSFFMFTIVDSIMKKLIRSLYLPADESHKGQNGKLMIIGGSSAYHGAALLAIIAAKRFVDLVYFCPAEQDAALLTAVKQIPEVIVDYNLSRLAEVDSVLVGIGSGVGKLPMELITSKSKKLIIDGDGLKAVKGNIPPGCILTPHEGEFNYLFNIHGTKDNVEKMARKNHCIIVKKGHLDIISDGHRTITNATGNPGMTKGGTGDVLAGFMAALACKNALFTAAVAAAYITGYAGDMLQKEVGYSFSAGDLAEKLPQAYFKLRRL